MSVFSLSRWRPAHLFVSWAVYWIALLAATLGPAVPAILRATAPNAKGEIAANLGGSILSLVVKQSGQVTWSGSVHVLTAVLWFAIPPLLIWALWVGARGSASREPARAEPLT